MKMYCPCGAPIWVKAHWTGTDIVLVLHDGRQPFHQGAEPLKTCPRCHCALTPADLTWLPEVSQPARQSNRRKILIVEDNDDLRQVLHDLFAGASFQVSTARDGQEALACLRQEGGWVVLLDWMLPGLDGRQVLARLQADPLVRTDTKVVVMSAGWRLEQARQTLESEVVAAWLSKPFAREAVLGLAQHLAVDAG